MALVKPCVSIHNLQENVIYTIEKKTSVGPYCEIELEDVRIRVPVYVDSFQTYFVRYREGKIELLCPRMRCDCDEYCEKCGCTFIQVRSFCTCLFDPGLEGLEIHNFDKFYHKIVQLMDENVGFPLEPSTCREDQVRQASGGWWLQVAQGRL